VNPPTTWSVPVIVQLGLVIRVPGGKLLRVHELPASPEAKLEPEIVTGVSRKPVLGVRVMPGTTVSVAVALSPALPFTVII
jgi:hypothetical protein